MSCTLSPFLNSLHSHGHQDLLKPVEGQPASALGF